MANLKSLYGLIRDQLSSHHSSPEFEPHENSIQTEDTLDTGQPFNQLDL